MQNYIMYLQNDHKDPKTIEAYIHAINELQKWYSETTGQRFITENITPLDLKDYVSWLATNQKQSPATINKKIAGLKSYFKYLLTENIIVANPMVNIKAKKTSILQQLPRWLTRSEQARFLHCINKNRNETKRLRDYAIAQTMLQAGLRSFETVALDVDDLDLRRNILTIRKGKGNKMAILPVNKDLNKALIAYLEVRVNNSNALFLSERKTRLTDRAVRHQFRNYFDQANLPDATVHSLRHSFCKNLLDAGTELTVVAQLARHESLETTRIYLTPSEHDLRQAVEKISSE